MADDKPFHNPFGVLGKLRNSLPEQPAAPAPPQSRDPQPPTGIKTYPRAVVRLERSGRGGKEVTIVEHLAIPPKDRDVWVKALKAALGCGGQVEGDTLVLQGDHRMRLPAILTARGVRKITVS